MGLTPGDFVVHPAYGVGIIAAIEEMKFTEDGQALFYRVDFDKTTIWVPVQIQEAPGVRPITPSGDMARYRAVLKSSPSVLSDDFRLRQVELDARLKQRTFQALCETVRDLSARSRQKPLNSHDLNLLKRTRQFLAQEWAAVTGKSIPEAGREIEAFLTEGNGSPAVA